MDADYLLGQKFSAGVQKLRPRTLQTLSAIFSDYVGSDTDLSSSFRLLFGNQLYLNLFLSESEASVAELSSLLAIAKESLSPVLAIRAESFVRGYFDSSDVRTLDFSANSYAHSDVNPKPSNGPSYENYGSVNSPIAEHATIFADDESLSSSPPPSKSPNITSSPVAAARSSLNLKQFFLLVLLAFIGFSVFKVPAICEPFGLCDKKVKSGKPAVTGESNKAKVQNSSNSLSPNLKIQTTPNAVDTQSRILRKSQVPVRPQPAPYNPGPPAADSAPLRQEALW